MQLIIDAVDIHELKTRIFDLNEQLNMVQPRMVPTMPSILQQTLCDLGNTTVHHSAGPAFGQTVAESSFNSASQTETKPAAKKTKEDKVMAEAGKAVAELEAKTFVEATKTQAPKPAAKKTKEITKEDIQKVVQAVFDKKGIITAKGLLSAHGVTVIRELPASKYESLYNACKAELS